MLSRWCAIFSRSRSGRLSKWDGISWYIGVQWPYARLESWSTCMMRGNISLLIPSSPWSCWFGGVIMVCLVSSVRPENSRRWDGPGSREWIIQIRFCCISLQCSKSAGTLRLLSRRRSTHFQQLFALKLNYRPLELFYCTSHNCTKFSSTLRYPLNFDLSCQTESALISSDFLELENCPSYSTASFSPILGRKVTFIQPLILMNPIQDFLEQHWTFEGAWYIERVQKVLGWTHRPLTYFPSNHPSLYRITFFVWYKASTLTEQVNWVQAGLQCAPGQWLFWAIRC